MMLLLMMNLDFAWGTGAVVLPVHRAFACVQISVEAPVEVRLVTMADVGILIAVGAVVSVIGETTHADVTVQPSVRADVEVS